MYIEQKGDRFNNEKRNKDCFQTFFTLVRTLIPMPQSDKQKFN